MGGAGREHGRADPQGGGAARQPADARRVRARCSVLWVYTGRVFDEKGSIMVAAGKTVPWRFNFAFGVAMLVLIGALTPPGFLWQKAMRAYAPDSQARITSAITGASVSAALTVAAIAAALA